MIEQQQEGLRARYNVLEKEFDNRIDALGIENTALINKETFDQNLSHYCKKFVQATGKTLSVRLMIPSEYGLPSILKQKMELIFIQMFPDYEFK